MTKIRIEQFGSLILESDFIDFGSYISYMPLVFSFCLGAKFCSCQIVGKKFKHSFGLVPTHTFFSTCHNFDRSDQFLGNWPNLISMP
jgi:hypothetical protein